MDLRRTLGGAVAFSALVVLVGCPPVAATTAPPLALDVTIDTVSPNSLSPKLPLQLTGTVRNPGRTEWLDAQVYLLISFDPATTLQGLDDFAAVPDTEGFGTTLVSFGLFDQIGDLPPGTTTQYVLSIPYADLPISGAPGVYHVGVSVLAGTPQGRDINSDGRADTLVPLLPAKPGSLPVARTITLLPITAPVRRFPDGAFLGEGLADSLAFGGRLRNLLNFAQAAPPGSLQILIDPALLAAIQDMSRGYLVKSLAASDAAAPGTKGKGQADATAWLTDFSRMVSTQPLLLLPWGTPAIGSLLFHHQPTVVRAAVRASERFAAADRIDTGVVGWQPSGGSSDRAVLVTQQAGTALQIMSRDNLPALVNRQGEPSSRSRVTLLTPNGPVQTLLAADSLAGLPLQPSTSALQVRQMLIADATVRSLTGFRSAHTTHVVGLPFSWNPGGNATAVNLTGAFGLPVLSGQSANDAIAGSALQYTGSVRPTGSGQPGLRSDVLAAIADLKDTGQTLASLLSGSARSTVQYRQHLAMAGSNAWRSSPAVATALIERQVEADAHRISKVTVTGPPFVALSSNSGRFSLTLSNGLSQQVTVRLVVTPRNPALKIEPLDPIVLAPGQRRDIAVKGTAAGSGLTAVSAQLATTRGHAFGRPWQFDVRATQIGLVIWIVMGVGGVVLFGTAGYRIIKRVRGARRARVKARTT